MNHSLPEEFPPALWRDICDADQQDNERCAYLAKEAVYWADGRHPNDLGILLDALRHTRAYGVSLEILEAAWNSSAPAGFRAQIAQDWVGTVLYGLNDPDGAVVVALHISRTAQELGNTFLSDFADLLMEWGLLEAAYPILQNLADQTPGDLSVRYNLGTCEKFRGNWLQALTAFKSVSQHENAGGIVYHNLYVAALAAKNEAEAERALKLIGQALPNTNWNLGEIVQVELGTTEQETPVEVLFAERVGPHQVRLRGLPQSSALPGYDAKLLIDIHPQKYPGTDEEQRLIFPVLSVLEDSAFEPMTLTLEDGACDEALQILEQGNVPARRSSNSQVVVAIHPQRRAELGELFERLRAL